MTIKEEMREKMVAQQEEATENQEELNTEGELLRETYFAQKKTDKPSPVGFWRKDKCPHCKTKLVRGGNYFKTTIGIVSYRVHRYNLYNCPDCEYFWVKEKCVEEW